MSVQYDARANEWQGQLDQIGGGTVTDARVASATLGALNAELLMDLNGKAVAVFDIRSAAVNAIFSFEATVDGTNYFAVPAINQATEAVVTAVTLTPTAAVTFMVGVSGYRRVRCRISTFTSGNAVVTGRASISDYSIYSKPYPSSLHVTATAAVNTGSTCTLPAAGVGLFHYITRIELVKLYAVVGVAAGAGVIITTTNLPGGPAFTTEQLASAAGTVARVITADYAGNPLKSSVANTATTFVAGAQLQTIWRWNVSYFISA